MINESLDFHKKIIPDAPRFVNAARFPSIEAAADCLDCFAIDPRPWIYRLISEKRVPMLRRLLKKNIL